MNTVTSLVTLIVLILIISYGTGLIQRGPERANKIVAWELKQLLTFGRWALKHLFQALANIFGGLAKALGPKKKTP